MKAERRKIWHVAGDVWVDAIKASDFDEALRKYGRHISNCELVIYGGALDCDCGFSEVTPVDGSGEPRG